MSAVTIKSQGLEKVLVQIKKMRGSVKDLSPAFSDMKGVIIQEFKANFPAAGSNLEMPWAPRVHFYPWPILIKTGTLMGNWGDDVSRDKLVINNPTEYATYHHFGTDRLPPRKIVGGSDKIKKIIHDRILKHIKKSF